MGRERNSSMIVIPIKMSTATLFMKRPHISICLSHYLYFLVMPKNFHANIIFKIIEKQII